MRPARARAFTTVERQRPRDAGAPRGRSRDFYGQRTTFVAPGSTHRSVKDGRFFFATVRVFTPPMKLPGLVTVAVSFVPARSFLPTHCLRLVVPNAFDFENVEPPGHFLPFGALQTTFSFEPDSVTLTCS